MKHGDGGSVFQDHAISLEETVAQSVTVVEDIVSLGKSMSLEVDGDDVEEELVEAHNTQLTTEKLLDLQREQQQTAAEGRSSEEEGKEAIPNLLMEEILGKWGEVQTFIEKYHPNKEVGNHATTFVNDHVVFFLRQALICS